MTAVKTAETLYQYQTSPEAGDVERPKEAIISDMLNAAQPGQADLDDITRQRLIHFTSELQHADDGRALGEYERYGAVKDRGLDIDRTRIAEKLSGKTVLVTGGTGLIGSALMKELHGLGAGRLVSVSRGVTQPTAMNPAVEYMYGDIRDKDAIASITDSVKPDIIFHVAADKYNHEAEARARHTLTTNIEGTQNVLAAAQASGVEQIVYASTGKATRPFSPDIYASSKKTGEWLMTKAASEGLLSSAVRFTHVVDDSNVRKKINENIEGGKTVRLQSPDVLFYIQSAKESAHLLLNSLLEAEPGVLNVQAIRDLTLPINLLDLGLGAIEKQNAKVPIYFAGVETGYEDKAWPGLYDPMTGGDVSPLINSLEAPEAEESEFCPAVDTFPLKIARSTDADKKLEDLLDMCHATADNGTLRATNQDLGWAMLDARLNALPVATLNRSASRVAKFALTEVLNTEHKRTGEVLVAALSEKLEAAQ